MTTSSLACSTQNRLTHHAVFCALLLACAGLCWRPLEMLVRLAVQNDAYSITVVIPFISAAFLYIKKDAIFPNVRYNAPLAAAFFIPGAILFGLAATFGSTYALTASVFSFVILITGCFTLCYGAQAMRAAAFPLLILLLMVPGPNFAIQTIVIALQNWSANGTSLLFRAFGVPFHRTDLVFDLPGVSIRVAEECSGIRSTLALFVTILVASQLSLENNWRKLTMCLLVAPIAVLKNSIRIVTLSTLAVYVNPAFLYGQLHRNGGVVFFLLGLGTLLGVLQFLTRSERRARANATNLDVTDGLIGANRPIAAKSVQTKTT